MENSEVRQTAKELGIPLWKVALKTGISEPTLTRWLRVPLSTDKKRRVMNAINGLAEEVKQ